MLLHDRPARPGTHALLARLVGFALVLVTTAALVAGSGQVSRRLSGPAASPASRADRPAVEPHPAKNPSPAAGLPSGLTPSSECLEGDALARAWLTAFLTRADRNDISWTSRVSPMSAPRLVDRLRLEGPKAVGLETLDRWQVDRIDRVVATDASLDTPTRQVLSYAATVRDGSRTEQKPFVLYSYLDPDGCWRVEDIEQPYSSEG